MNIGRRMSFLRIAMNVAAYLFGGVVMRRYCVTMIVAVSVAWSVQ
jgi:hypothetical protein